MRLSISSSRCRKKIITDYNATRYLITWVISWKSDVSDTTSTLSEALFPLCHPFVVRWITRRAPQMTAHPKPARIERAAAHHITFTLFRHAPCRSMHRSGYHKRQAHSVPSLIIIILPLIRQATTTPATGKILTQINFFVADRNVSFLLFSAYRSAYRCSAITVIGI